MTKKQKILLSSLLGLFVVPEILWNPTANFIYELLQSHYGNTRPFRDSFLMDSSNANMFSTVLFIQFAGLFLSAVYLIVINKDIKNKWLLWFSVLVLLCGSVVSFFLMGLSIKLKSFGL